MVLYRFGATVPYPLNSRKKETCLVVFYSLMIFWSFQRVWGCVVSRMVVGKNMGQRFNMRPKVGFVGQPFLFSNLETKEFNSRALQHNTRTNLLTVTVTIRERAKLQRESYIPFTFHRPSFSCHCKLKSIFISSFVLFQQLGYW